MEHIPQYVEENIRQTAGKRVVPRDYRKGKELFHAAKTEICRPEDSRLPHLPELLKDAPAPEAERRSHGMLPVLS